MTKNKNVKVFTNKTTGNKVVTNKTAGKVVKTASEVSKSNMETYKNIFNDLPARKTKVTVKSKLFNKLNNTKNVFSVRTEKNTKAGIRVSKNGTKKQIVVDVLVPSTTIDGSPRVVKMSLSGRQAYALYRTLDKFYFGQALNSLSFEY